MMMQTCGGSVRRRGVSAWVFGIVTVMVAYAVGAGLAGAQAASSKIESHGPRSYETLYLNGAMSNNDAVDVVTDLRNMIPQAKIYYVPRQKAISIYADANDQMLAKQVLAGVDRPVRSYKVTYTLTETGGGHAPKTQHIAMLIASGGAAEVKQGRRVPIVTGSSDSGGKVETQVQYLDVGVSIRAKLSGGQGHLKLDSQVGESQELEKQTLAGIQDPVIQQTMLTGNSTLADGTAVSLGSLDIPANGSVGEQHITVEVAVEPAG